jgi:hypothetical protein
MYATHNLREEQFTPALALPASCWRHLEHSVSKLHCSKALTRQRISIVCKANANLTWRSNLHLCRAAVHRSQNTEHSGVPTPCAPYELPNAVYFSAFAAVSNLLQSLTLRQTLHLATFPQRKAVYLQLQLAPYRCSLSSGAGCLPAATLSGTCRLQVLVLRCTILLLVTLVTGTRY